MNIFSLFPQVIYRTSSAYNKRIEVHQTGGEYYLTVDGVLQSGIDIQKMYVDAFAKFQLPASANNVLVLGLGGGGVIKLIRLTYPDCHIDAVDIDEVMIGISNKYFQLSAIKDLTCTVADAKIFIKKTKQKYDIIIIDLYIGDTFPAFQTKQSFYMDIKKHLSFHGVAVMNFQGTREYTNARNKIDFFLPEVFSHVESTLLRRNKLYLLKK